VCCILSWRCSGENGRKRKRVRDCELGKNEGNVLSGERLCVVASSVSGMLYGGRKKMREPLRIKASVYIWFD